MMERALYCTSPTGISQLVQHLHMRGVEFTDADLGRELAALGSRLIRRDVLLPGAGSVPMLSLAGYGI